MRIVGPGGLFLAVALGSLLGCGGAATSTGTSGGGTTGSTTTGGSTIGTSSGTTGATTGPACGGEYYHCFNKGVQSNCCAGYICNDANLCEPPAGTTSGGGTTGAATTGGGATTTGSGAGTTGATGGACPGPSGDGGPCVTSVDCNLGFVCSNALGDGGYCKPPVIPTIGACSPAGADCGSAGNGICCGVCVNGSCRNLATTPCGDYPGALCAAASDCCRDWTCVSGGCQPSCGLENALCDPAHGNSDCCTGEGLTCEGYGGDGGAPYECNNIYQVPSGGGCASFCSEGGPPECELGSPCDPFAGPPDNCTSAGLFCDTSFDVCVQPEYGDECLQGGPPCGAGPNYINSNATMVCDNTMFTSGPVCVQLCGSSKDCLFAEDTCCTSCTPAICVPAFLNGTCNTYFAPCDSAASGDGVCAPVNLGGTLAGTCIQAATVGGAAGSACTIYANRQNPAFCDVSDWCSGGVCVPSCNAGFAGDPPACPDSNMACVAALGSGDSDDLGYCVTPCDFVDGGGCVAPDGGLAQVCFPGIILLGGTDQGNGYCVGQSANPLPVGAACNPLNGNYDFPSPCVAGAICWNNPVAGGGFSCDQLCLLSDDTCATGTTCHAMNLAASVYSTESGVCY